MKKEYVSPDMELFLFEAEDCLATSAINPPIIPDEDEIPIITEQENVFIIPGKEYVYVAPDEDE